MDQQRALRQQVFRPDIAERVSAFRHILTRDLPGLVDRVIVYGSQARGDAREDSDIDIAVLVNDGLHDDERVSRAIWNAMLEHAPDNLELEPLTFPRDFLDPVNGHYRSELARRIGREGIEV